MAPPPRGAGGPLTERVTEPPVREGIEPREPIMTTDRKSIFTMLYDPEVGNELVNAWTTNDGLLCAVLKINDHHYTGYVQLPEWLLTAVNKYDAPFDRTTIENDWMCRPHGGITYGPDRSGWVGFDTNHARDRNADTTGDPLTTYDFEAEHLWSPESEPDAIDWDPLNVKAETQQFAECLAIKLWEIRDGRWSEGQR